MSEGLSWIRCCGLFIMAATAARNDHDHDRDDDDDDPDHR
jgi:hypothetical protein